MEERCQVQGEGGRRGEGGEEGQLVLRELCDAERQSSFSPVQFSNWLRERTTKTVTDSVKLVHMYQYPENMIRVNIHLKPMFNQF